MPIRFRSTACLLTLLLFSQALLAAVHPAQQLVSDTTSRVLERLRSERDALQKDSDRIYPLVEELILPHFDFRRMSAWVLGRHWRTATPEQRKQFSQEFQTLLIRTYATALLEYTDQKIRYLPFHAAEGDRRVTVKTEIVQSGGVNIPIFYSMYRNREGEWKVYDISIDGVSLVTNYRSSFASEIARGGMDALLTKLAKMNSKNKEDAGEQP